ncbi:MAG: hypothetical protein JNM69_01705 [Archangium sp.]|nr:hypothetical protein [Archangium sp.]
MRGTLTLSPQKKSALNVEIPTRVELTIVGSAPVTMQQTAITTLRRFDAMPDEVTVRPMALGATSLEHLRLSQPGVTITIDQAVAKIGGEAVNVSGTVMTSAGDVIDQTTFTGTFALAKETGGSKLQLRSVRPSGALRPFDELDVRAEQPLAVADLSQLKVLQNGVPITFAMQTGSRPFTNLFRIRATELMVPGARLTLGGAVTHGDVAMVVPSEPQVKVEEVVGGWQFTSFEPRGTVKTLVGSGAPVADPLVQVANGATTWRREVVPAGARRLTLWVQALASTEGPMLAGTPARVTVSTVPGAGNVLAEVEPSVACSIDTFTFCSAWKEVSFDVSTLGGRSLYVEASSTAPSFFAPVHAGFLVAEPRFGN